MTRFFNWLFRRNPRTLIRMIETQIERDPRLKELPESLRRIMELED